MAHGFTDRQCGTASLAVAGDPVERVRVHHRGHREPPRVGYRSYSAAWSSRSALCLGRGLSSQYLKDALPSVPSFFALNGRNQVCGGRIIACSLIPLIRAIGKIRGHSDQRNPHSHWLTRGTESRSPEGSADFHIGDSPRSPKQPTPIRRWALHTIYVRTFQDQIDGLLITCPPF